MLINSQTSTLFAQHQSETKSCILVFLRRSGSAGWVKFTLLVVCPKVKTVKQRDSSDNIVLIIVILLFLRDDTFPQRYDSFQVPMLFWSVCQPEASGWREPLACCAGLQYGVGVKVLWVGNTILQTWKSDCHYSFNTFFSTSPISVRNSKK